MFIGKIAGLCEEIRKNIAKKISVFTILKYVNLINNKSIDRIEHALN